MENNIKASTSEKLRLLVHERRCYRDKVAPLFLEEETKPKDITSETEPCNLEEV